MEIIEEIIEYKRRFYLKEISADYFWRKYKALRKEFYASMEWYLVRKEVKQRDIVCVNDECGEPGRDVDHIILLFDQPELALDPDNLRYICLKCHKAKHGKLNKKGRLSKRINERNSTNSK